MKTFLLDCTLRDGGYVNNWEFGEKNIDRIVHGLEESGINALELGFLREKAYNPDSSDLSNIESADRLLEFKRENIIYSVMLEAFNPYPLEKLSKHRRGGIDLIRVCIWKRYLKEHMRYCKAVAEKGYRITIQPSRVEQYNDVEFSDMLKHANELNPFAVYVVDTWGTQYPKQICHYLELADKHLDKNIKLGFHGHNNRLQAFSSAIEAMRMQMDRELYIDSSIMGMGRGAGNLNTEVIMDYLNNLQGNRYDVEKIVDIYNDSLRELYHAHPWGYSVYYFLCSKYNCNPNYATFFSDNGIEENLFVRFLETLDEKEKTVFSKELAETRIAELQSGE